jgi:hypothetical protein
MNFDPNAINSYENVSATKRTAESKSAAKGGAGGGWMMALAMTLGNMADKMGEQVAATAKKIDAATDAKFAEGKSNDGQSGSHGISALNAEMQVQTQLLSMFMGAVSNIIKTIGEGNAGLSRKQ